MDTSPPACCWCRLCGMMVERMLERQKDVGIWRNNFKRLPVCDTLDPVFRSDWWVSCSNLGVRCNWLIYVPYNAVCLVLNHLYLLYLFLQIRSLPKKTIDGPGLLIRVTWIHYEFVILSRIQHLKWHWHQDKGIWIPRPEPGNMAWWTLAIIQIISNNE